MEKTGRPTNLPHAWLSSQPHQPMRVHLPQEASAQAITKEGNCSASLHPKWREPMNTNRSTKTRAERSFGTTVAGVVVVQMRALACTDPSADGITSTGVSSCSVSHGGGLKGHHARALTEAEASAAVDALRKVQENKKRRPISRKERLRARLALRLAAATATGLQGYTGRPRRASQFRAYRPGA